MSGAFQPGSAPPQHFFRDVIYQQSAASGTVVPWDVGQAQPALATAREIFKGSVLDVGTGVCCPPPLSVFTLGHQQWDKSDNSVTYGVNSDRDGGQRALAVNAP